VKVDGKDGGIRLASPIVFGRERPVAKRKARAVGEKGKRGTGGGKASNLGESMAGKKYLPG